MPAFLPQANANRGTFRMEAPTHAVNWVEIPVNDLERAAKFYSAIYDYEMPTQQMGTVTMGFLLFEMGKGVGGAIVCGEGYVPGGEGCKVYLNGGSDLQVILALVENAGGTVVMGKTHISDEIGHFGIFEDTEGNRLYVHSPN